MHAKSNDVWSCHSHGHSRWEKQQRTERIIDLMQEELLPLRGDELLAPGEARDPVPDLSRHVGVSDRPASQGARGIATQGVSEHPGKLRQGDSDCREKHERGWPDPTPGAFPGLLASRPKK